MRAIVYDRYGPPEVLRLAEVEVPQPGPDEALIQVHAASVNAADWRLLRADPFPIRLTQGLRRPKHQILGSDVAGRVVAVGSRVTRLRLGDEVFGEIGSGTFAEYACGAERRLAHKPNNLSFAEAAAVPMAAVTAWQGLRKHGQLRAGMNVLITGASGGVGTFAVQLAKHIGARVSGECRPAKMNIVRAIGADIAIDCTAENVDRSTERYDLILDVAAARPVAYYRRLLRADGKYVMAGGSIARMLESAALSIVDGRRIGSVASQVNHEDLDEIRTMLEARHIRPIIDRTFPLEVTAGAIRYLEGGHARGKIVITVPGES